MSPDQYASNPVVQRLISAAEGIAKLLPNAAKYFTVAPTEFRGLTMFIGDNADVVIGLRIFDDDGQPVVIWGSGNDPLQALINLDQRVSTGNWKPDLPKPKVTGKK